MDRVIAIDWSGAKARGGRGGIALAEIASGRLVRLDTSMDRDQAVAAVKHANASGGVLVGMDFAFSLPSWYLRERGYRHAVDFWRDLSADADAGAEAILARCEPPFWGKAGTKRPHGPEADCRRTTLKNRAKPVFQIGGAGSVGTGSLRGMPHLLRLREAGWSIWPFDEPSERVVVEIYTRKLYCHAGISSVVKSNAVARETALAEIRDFPVPNWARASAITSEHAFDALTAAVGLWKYVQCGHFEFPQADATDRLEGMIFPPD